MLNSFQTPFRMTTRPKNSIAFWTCMKLIVSFLNVIGYQAAHLFQPNINNRYITKDTPWKRPDVPWTDADFGDDLFELYIQNVWCDKNQLAISELLFYLSGSREDYPVFF